jgi:hypothetical protein
MKRLCGRQLVAKLKLRVEVEGRSRGLRLRSRQISAILKTRVTRRRL